MERFVFDTLEKSLESTRLSSVERPIRIRHRQLPSEYPSNQFLRANRSAVRMRENEQRLELSSGHRPATKRANPRRLLPSTRSLANRVVMPVFPTGCFA